MSQIVGYIDYYTVGYIGGYKNKYNNENLRPVLFSVHLNGPNINYEKKCSHLLLCL